MTIEKFKPGFIENQQELDTFASKVRTHGFSGSMGGPGSRITVKNALVEAASKNAIDFEKTVVVVALWETRMRDARIAAVNGDATGGLIVQCTDEGRDGSSIDCTSMQQWVSFAATTIARPGGKSGTSWSRVSFLGDGLL